MHSKIAIAVAVAVAGASLAHAQSSAYGQCGGQGWTGATTCVSGYYCSEQNDYYSQCIPGAASSSSSAAHTTSTTRPSSSSSSSHPSSSASSTTSSSTTVPTGSPWSAAYTKAEAALAKLSLSDKVNVVTGVGWNAGQPCVGNTPAISAIDYPSLCLQDGPLGVRYAPSITAFTPGIQAASSWNTSLIMQRGQFFGVESKSVGVNVQLGPVGGPLGKNPEGGRNWESFGPDPYLSGIAMGLTIEGMQSSGVQATAKHFILNEQELNRNTMSSNIDDRTIHELYLWPFADAVHSNVAAVMCSYNQVNSTWACENPDTIQTLLKGQLGFPGYIMTDWGAQQSTVAAANSGLDMSMPGNNYDGSDTYWGSALSSAVSSGQVAESRVDDMVTRILAAWYMLGQDSGYPSINLSLDVQGTHKTNVRAVAQEGIVLLKNEDNILPLNGISTMAIVGSDAVSGEADTNGCTDKGCDSGSLGMGWGSGSVNYPYFVTPDEAIGTQAASAGIDVTLSGTDDTGSGASAASGQDVALVFINADSGEGYITVEGNAGDRNNLDPWHSGNELVGAVAGVCDNVIVVIHTVGPIILETILSYPSVKAIVWAGLPSQESGNALVDVLWGSVSPSGKLPYTIAKSESDYCCAPVSGNDDFSEGLYIDYRYFDNAGIAPQYEFGFGLSYTNFTYSGLSVKSNVTSGAATGEIIPGGPSDLWDDVVTVTATVSNTGKVAGAEVAQLYLSYPSSAPATPPKQLRGFDKLPLSVGTSDTATFSLRRRDLSYWDVGMQQWVVPSGTFGVSVGASSRDIRLTGSIVVS